MVLIGGKNGAGKTTLFNSIKICLYGCVVFGFETNNTRYYEEVEKIINTNEKLKKVGESEVVIDLLLDDGKDDHVYTFDRLWKVKGNKIIENFTLSKDGEIVSETEKEILRASYSKLYHQICLSSTFLTVKKLVISFSTETKTLILRKHS